MCVRDGLGCEGPHTHVCVVCVCCLWYVCVCVYVVSCMWCVCVCGVHVYGVYVLCGMCVVCVYVVCGIYVLCVWDVVCVRVVWVCVCVWCVCVRDGLGCEGPHTRVTMPETDAHISPWPGVAEGRPGAPGV